MKRRVYIYELYPFLLYFSLFSVEQGLIQTARKNNFHLTVQYIFIRPTSSLTRIAVALITRATPIWIHYLREKEEKKKKKSIPLQYFSPNTIASHFRFNQPAISTIVYPLQFLRTRERIKFKRRRSSKQKFLPRTILPPAIRFLLPSFQ